jgi:hypothetical protein
MTEDRRRQSIAMAPAELLVRRDRQLRFERGGIVYATDGRIGVLKQIVVDDGAGEVLELLIALDRSDATVSLPPEAVDKTAGSAVFLVANREAVLARNVPTPTHPTRLLKVDPKALIGKRTRFPDHTPNPRRTIAQAGKDYVETPPLPAGARVERRIGVAPSGAD